MASVIRDNLLAAEMPREDYSVNTAKTPASHEIYVHTLLPKPHQATRYTYTHNCENPSQQDTRIHGTAEVPASETHVYTLLSKPQAARHTYTHYCQNLSQRDTRTHNTAKTPASHEIHVYTILSKSQPARHTYIHYCQNLSQRDPRIHATAIIPASHEIHV